MEIKEVERLTLRPGDRIVLYTDLHLRPEQAKCLRDSLKDWAGDTKIIVCTPNFRIAVIGEAEQPAEGYVETKEQTKETSHADT